MARLADPGRIGEAALDAGEAQAQAAQGVDAVAAAIAVVGDLDRLAAGEVDQAHGGFRPVEMLATRATGAEAVLATAGEEGGIVQGVVGLGHGTQPAGSGGYGQRC